MDIASRFVFVLAMNTGLMPAVSAARVMAILFKEVIAVFFIRVGTLLYSDLWYMAVVVVPPVVMVPVTRVSINPFIIPARSRIVVVVMVSKAVRLASIWLHRR